MRKAGTFGAIACVFFFFSPGWLPFDPSVVQLVMPLLFVVSLTVAVLGAVLANLPENARMTPMQDAVPAACRGLIARMQELGFTRLGPVLRVHLEPEATLVPLWNETERTYATAFTSDGAPAKAHYDFVTVFEGDVALTSSANVAGGVLPSADGCFLQIFHGEEPEVLLEHHREGCEHLARAARVELKPRCASFEQLLASALRRQREAFLKAPIRNAWTALSRVVRKTSPAIGPLGQQTATRDRIDALRGGGLRQPTGAR